MSERPLPEAIRGGWYSLPDDVSVDAIDEATDVEILTFGLDGGFVRYRLDEDEADEDREEVGEYTFDGNFLILRGARTKTYRVHPRAPWFWDLEGKKEERKLLRGTYEADEPKSIPEERRREIDRLPMRVLVKSRFENPEGYEINALVHSVADAEDVQIGACFAEPVDEDGTMWIAVTPFVEGIGPETWGKVVRKSYLSVYRDISSELEQVELQLIGESSPRLLKV